MAPLGPPRPRASWLKVPPIYIYIYIWSRGFLDGNWNILEPSRDFLGSMLAHVGSSCLNRSPSWPQVGSRLLKIGSKPILDASWNGWKFKKTLKNHWWPHVGFKLPKVGFNLAHAGPKLAPTCLKLGPCWVQI